MAMIEGEQRCGQTEINCSHAEVSIKKRYDLRYSFSDSVNSVMNNHLKQVECNVKIQLDSFVYKRTRVVWSSIEPHNESLNAPQYEC